MVSDFAKTHGRVAVHHSGSRVVFHYLVLHESQLLGHFHRLVLVLQHVVAHFLYDHFAALDVFVSALQLDFEPINHQLLLVCERL